MTKTPAIIYARWSVTNSKPNNPAYITVINKIGNTISTMYFNVFYGYEWKIMIVVKIKIPRNAAIQDTARTSTLPIAKCAKFERYPTIYVMEIQYNHKTTRLDFLLFSFLIPQLLERIIDINKVMIKNIQSNMMHAAIS